MAAREEASVVLYVEALKSNVSFINENTLSENTIFALVSESY